MFVGKMKRSCNLLGLLCASGNQAEIGIYKSGIRSGEAGAPH